MAGRGTCSLSQHAFDKKIAGQNDITDLNLLYLLHANYLTFLFYFINKHIYIFYSCLAGYIYILQNPTLKCLKVNYIHSKISKICSNVI